MPPHEVRLIREDMMQASLLHHAASMASRKTLAIVASAAVIAFALVYALDWPDKHAWLAASLAAAGMVAYLYALFLVVRWVRIPLTIRRTLREQKNLLDDYVIDWSDAAYSVRGPTIRSNTPWDHFLKWRENERVILLYQTSKLFQIVPKRAFPETALDGIRARLNRAGVPRAPLMFS